MMTGVLLAVAAVLNLEQPGRVTLVVEREDGTRVRNLVADAEFAAGRHAVDWDGRDDNGAPVPVGAYRWRGLVHDRICAAYRGSFYSPGSTPWKRHTKPGGWNLRSYGGGGWLSDHAAPWCVFTDERAVYLGCRLAEAGDAMIRCDLDGNKTWGQMWLGLSGADAMCTDGDNLYVAGEGGWQGKRLGVTVYNPVSGQWLLPPPEVRKHRVMHDAAFVREASSNFNGIAGIYLTTNRIVLALNDRRRLAFFDRKTGAFDHEEPLRNARALSLKPSTKVMRGLATDADGNIYRCATNAAEQCVKVFSPKGQLLRTIGRPGGRKEGKYDPEAMGNPVDVAVDAKGLVWVVENCLTPKRVSVWTREGKLVREYVGTPFYGGGGSLDGHLAYYGGMRFRFNDDFSQAELDSVMWIPSEHKDLPVSLSLGGSFDIVKFRGRRYLVDDDGACKKYSAIYEEVGDRLVPRVIVSNATRLSKNGRHQENCGLSLWQNGVTSLVENVVYGAEWAMRFGPNLELVFRTKDRKSLVVLKPEDGGILQYVSAKAETVALPAEMVGVCSLSMTPDASAFVINRGGCGDQGAPKNLFGAVSREGKTLWTYPNPYPSNCHNSPLPKRGELRHTLGIEGFAMPAEGEAGALMLLNGNKGTRYLFTTDGLFVQELFGDMRQTEGSTQNFEAATRGMDLATKSLGDECFGGWMGAVEGKVCVIGGKDSLNVCELTGLGSVRRLKGGALRLEEEAKPLEDLPAAERPPLRVMRMGGFGFQNNWWSAQERPFAGGADSPAKFALGCSHKSLRLRIEVKDKTPFENAGTDPLTLFHSGDAVDFRWASDPKADEKRTSTVAGDLRFVVAPTQEGIAVVRYTFVDPEAKTAPVEFASLVSTYKVARVEKVEKAKAEVVRKKDSYVLTLDLPWKEALGEAGVPKAGELRKFDGGVLFGDATGSRVMRRTYYFDPGSQEVSDIPSETRVNPSAWGAAEF